MPDNGEPIDINGLSDEVQKNKDEDLDDIDFKNYKGIYQNDEGGQKY